MDSYLAEQKWWRTPFIKAKMIIMVIVLLGLPFLVSSQWVSVAVNINYYILAALGVQLLIGYCGQITLGHAAFVAVGGFGSALMVLHFPWPQFIVDAGLAYPISMIVAAFMAGIWSVLFGLPSARVKGFYLIMTTMAAQWITVPLVIAQYVTRIHGDSPEIPVPAGTFKLGPVVIDSDTKVYYFSLVLVVICLVAMGNMLRSRVGRAWVAIRDNDIAAETMGVNIVRYKLVAFFVAGFFAGLAGAFYVSSLSLVSPEHYDWKESLMWVGVILIGGVGSIQGLVFGSTFVILVFKLLDVAVTQGSMFLGDHYPQITWLSSKLVFLKDCAFGLAIILFLTYEPNGLAYRYWQLKNYFNLWPFSYTGKGG